MYTDNKPFALITGASEGLGKAMAIECASRGINLVLVALPGIELYQLSSYIRKRYGVNVCEFELDLTEKDNCVYLHETILRNNIQVNMLINNAGCGGANFFEERSFDVFKKQIDLNIATTVQLTHLFLPELKKHNQSYILNVSSLSVFFYLAKKAVYGATKTFVYYFSKSLRKELKQYGVTVSVLCPGGFNSNPAVYFQNQLTSFFSRLAILNPEDIAPVAIDGLLKGKERIIPGLVNKIFLRVDKLLPAWLKNIMTLQQMKKLNSANIEKLLKGETPACGRQAEQSTTSLPKSDTSKFQLKYFIPKQLFLIALMLLTATTVFSQEYKSVFFEFGGNGIGISANFDSRFSKSEKGLGFRAGIGVLPGISATDLNSGQTDITTPAMLVIPIGINHLAGKAPHYFESGIGADYVNFSGKYSFFGSDVGIKGGTVLFVPSIGYRYAKTGKAFQGRIFLSPLIGSGGIIPWVGFSAGYKF